MKKASSERFAGRQHRERVLHVGSRAVRPHAAVGDLTRERRHLVAQGGEHDRRQAAVAVDRPQIADEAADLAERLPGLDAEALVRRAVAHADAEAEAALRDLVEEGRGRREVERVARVDVGDRGAERYALGHHRDAFAQRHAVAHARAEDAAEAEVLDLAGQVERAASPSGNGGERQGGHPGHGSSSMLGPPALLPRGRAAGEARSYTTTHPLLH